MSDVPITPGLLEAGFPAHSQSAWLEWIATVDHKRIGILYLLTTLFFFCLGGIEALLMRIQLAWPGNTFLSPEAYNQIFTMHGTTMVFLVVVPLLLGLANYLTPLMIGASDMALPRLNAFSFWVFLFGGFFSTSALFPAMRRARAGSVTLRSVKRDTRPGMGSITGHLRCSASA